MMACETASLGCVKILVEHNASVFSTDAVSSQTPLHYVCSGSGKGGERNNIVRFLIEKGGDVSGRDSVWSHYVNKMYIGSNLSWSIGDVDTTSFRSSKRI